MAVKNFGGGSRKDAENYRLFKIGNKILFGTNCEPGDEGAIQMTRTKDGKNHKSGDVYYIKGGNAISGKVAYLAVEKGYNNVGANLVIGLTEDDGPFEFVSLPLVSDKNKINDATRRLLPALAKSELGEPVTIAAYTFDHKAGDEIKAKEGEVIGHRERDGYSNYLNVYQEHLKSDKNKNGKIEVAENELFVQERLVQKGRNLVALAPGERAAEGQSIVYDEGVAEDYAKKVIADIRARLPKRERVSQLAEGASAGHDFQESASPSDEDMTFGDDDSVPARQRM